MHLLPACPHTCTLVCPTMQTLSNSRKRWSCAHSPAAPPSPSRRPPSKGPGSCRCTCRQTLAAAPLCECRVSSCGPPVFVLTRCAHHTSSSDSSSPYHFTPLRFNLSFPRKSIPGSEPISKCLQLYARRSALKPCLGFPLALFARLLTSVSTSRRPSPPVSPSLPYSSGQFKCFR
jgi:hypothetical protein